MARTVDGASTQYTWDVAASLPVIITDSNSLYQYGLLLIAMQQGGSAFYYHQDGLGSTRQLTDEQGRVGISYGYDPFGQATLVSGTSSNPFRYTGQMLDETGMYYLRARYYEPANGRFTGRDPILLGYANSQTINRYVYTLNNPLKYADPAGLWTVSIGLGGAAFVGVGVRINVVTLAFDDKGNVAVLTGIGGGGWINAGFNRVGPGLTVTNAPTVDKLAGWSVQFGGQIGEGASIGAEWVTFSDSETGVAYHGITVAGGAAAELPLPGELHASFENDQLRWTGNISNLLRMAREVLHDIYDRETILRLACLIEERARE